MESKEIRELIELISRSNFKTFELEREGFRMKLVKAEAGGAAGAAEIVQTVAVQDGANGAAATAAAPAVEPGPAPAKDANGLVELNSPIVGTFYSAPSPDAPNFVDVGTRVKKGQVLCIVEAMKVMNEIESEFDGEVVDVLVSNAQPVEYGEVLFRLRRVP